MLNVSFAYDDNYSPYLAICLVSLLKNNIGDFDEIEIFVLDSGIKKINKEKIRKIAHDYGADISFIHVADIEEKYNLTLNKMSVKGDFSLATYSRLFIASLLLETVDKVIYLDCDALVLDSFKEILNLDLNNYLAAGVLALNCTAEVKKAIDLNEDDLYINAGMLLINLKRWRQENVENQFLEKLVEFNLRGKHFGMDQGVINNVLSKNLLVLNPKYNLEGSLHNTGYDITFKLNGNIQKNYYSREVLDDAIENPVFQHFCVGNGEIFNRPWLNRHHEDNKLYRKYFELADFEFDEVFDYHHVALIKRFNRFLARNKLTSFLICKVIQDKLAKKIVGNKMEVDNLTDIERW